MRFEIINKQAIIEQLGEDFYNNMEHSIDFATENLTEEEFIKQIRKGTNWLMPRWNVRDIMQEKVDFVFSCIVAFQHKFTIEYLWQDGVKGVTNHVH